jgi:uncharacterized protein (TIGR02231 family)
MSAGLAFLLAPLGAAEIAVPTAPSEVTVYPQGARVLRQGSVQALAGEQTLLLQGLPAGLREDSLRLSVQGPAGTKVLAVRLRQAFGEKEAQERRRELEARLQALRDEKDDLGDRIAARQAEAEILKAVASKDASRSDAKSLAGLPESAAAVGKRLAGLSSANRKDQRAQRDLDARIKALQGELDGQGPGSTRTRVAEADLLLPAAGALNAELSYFVDSAGWSPRYDLRLKAADKEPSVELEFLAELRQSSGEDWKGVSLSLSTARPTQDSQVPDPTQWWLDYAPQYQVRSLKASGAVPAAAPMADAMQMAGSAPAAYEQAQTQDLGPSTLFVVGRKQSIPSDGNGHRVAISSGKHPVELSLVVVPRLSNAGFIEAKLKYQGAQPLLPGPAQLFRDVDLAGQAYLAYTAPGEELTLGFGQDERIKAERVRRTQTGGSVGFLASKDRIRYDWALKVSNHHQGPRSVEVREQLPRSRQDDIKVSAIALEPKPLAEAADKPGLKVWKLDLKPGEAQELRVAYEVRWPDGQRVQGLE